MEKIAWKFQYNTGNSCCGILTPNQPNISGSVIHYKPTLLRIKDPATRISGIVVSCRKSESEKHLQTLKVPFQWKWHKERRVLLISIYLWSILMKKNNVEIPVKIQDLKSRNWPDSRFLTERNTIEIFFVKMRNMSFFYNFYHFLWKFFRWYIIPWYDIPRYDIPSK